MGRVYLGRGSDGAAVAVKVVRHDLLLDEGEAEFRRRFRREAEAAQAVAGPWAAAVIAADPGAPVPWLDLPVARHERVRAHVGGTPPPRILGPRGALPRVTSAWPDVGPEAARLSRCDLARQAFAVTPGNGLVDQVPSQSQTTLCSVVQAMNLTVAPSGKSRLNVLDEL